MNFSGLLRCSTARMAVVRKFCSSAKPSEAQLTAEQINMVKPSTDTITNTIAPNRLHRILLVISRNYPTLSEVPASVSAQSIHRAMDRFRVFVLTMGVFGFCILYAGTALKSSRAHWQSHSDQLLLSQEAESAKFEPQRKPDVWQKKRAT